MYQNFVYDPLTPDDIAAQISHLIFAKPDPPSYNVVTSKLFPSSPWKNNYPETPGELLHVLVSFICILIERGFYNKSELSHKTLN